MMSKNVVFYLPEQHVDEKIDGNNKVRISRTKNEETLFPLKEKDSPTYRLIEVVAKDKNLRQLFFSKSYLTYSFSRSYPVGVVFPIFLKSQRDFVKGTDQGRFSEKTKHIIKEMEKIKSEIEEDLIFGFFSEFMTTIFSDPKFIQIIRSRRISKDEDVQMTLSEIIERNQERYMTLITENLDSLGRIEYALELSRIEKALKFITMADENYNILSYAVELPKDIDDFCDSLTKLSLIGASLLSLESVCLDCKLRYDKEKIYSLSERNINKVRDLRVECPSCGGSTIIHYLTVYGGGGLKGLMLTNKLQEAIIALVISELDPIKKVYVSKKVSAIEGGNVQKGLEIDVVAITKDNRLILTEVSTTADIDNAMHNANRKLDNFNKYNIPFDKYIYIAPMPSIDRRITLEDNAYILTAKHLPNLGDHVENLIS